MDLLSGSDEERRHFASRNAEFLRRWPWFLEVVKKVFARAFEARGNAEGEISADKVIFFIGRQIPEDFKELVLLAANGNGYGALRLLRPMFEDLVTMMFLIDHQDHAGRFVDRMFVDQMKFVEHVKRVGGDPLTYVTAEVLRQVKENFERVRSNYRVACPKCGTERDMMSWTDVDLASMASKVGIGRLYVSMCYVPTLHVHTNSLAIGTRLREVEGGVGFDPRPQRKQADLALRAAHVCLCLAIDRQVRFFGLDVDLDRLNGELQACWGIEPKDLAG